MKNLLKKLTFISFLVIVFGLNAYSQGTYNSEENPHPAGISVWVTVPSFSPYTGPNNKALIEITNNFTSIDYFTYAANTVVISDEGDKVYVSAASYPNFAKVNFYTLPDSFNGTIHAKVTIFSPEGYVLAYGTGSVTGNFDENHQADITISSWGDPF